MKAEQPVQELPGLKAQVDQVLYMPAFSYEGERPHHFAYFITIINGSDRAITVVARKWIVKQIHGETTVVEGDGVVGETPRLEPGESFSYDSFHAVGSDATVEGAYFCLDDSRKQFCVRIPLFALEIPNWGL